MTITVTDWFDGSIAPIWPGEYERLNEGGVVRHFWTGAEWLQGKEDSPASYMQPWNNSDDFQWRGVTEPQDEFWKMLNGALISVSQMSDSHAKNVLRLVLRRRREGRAALVLARLVEKHGGDDYHGKKVYS